VPNTAVQGNVVLKLGGGTIQIGMDANLPVPRSDVVEWVRRAAVAVTGYFGRFPAKHLLITIRAGGDRPVAEGVTYGTVLKDLHNELGTKPGTVDLDSLWKRLGVKYNKGAITFYNDAPSASIRKAIASNRQL
jgi:hypothetical protein